jgi:hypothetical protein
VSIQANVDRNGRTDSDHEADSSGGDSPREVWSEGAGESGTGGFHGANDRTRPVCYEG